MAARSMIANEAGGDLYDVLSDDEGLRLDRRRRRGGPRLLLRHRPGDDQGGARQPRRPRPHPGGGAAPGGPRAARRRLRRGTSPPSPCCGCDLETGEGLLSNAGHPYPLLMAGGEVEEIEISASAARPGPTTGTTRTGRSCSLPAAPSSSSRTACSRPWTATRSPTASSASARAPRRRRRGRRRRSWRRCWTTGGATCGRPSRSTTPPSWCSGARPARETADEGSSAERLWLALAGGLAAFALGVALAVAFLPEWRAARPADPRALRAGVPADRRRGPASPSPPAGRWPA